MGPTLLGVHPSLSLENMDVIMLRTTNFFLRTYVIKTLQGMVSFQHWSKGKFHRFNRGPEPIVINGTYRGPNKWPKKVGNLGVISPGFTWSYGPLQLLGAHLVWEFQLRINYNFQAFQQSTPLNWPRFALRRREIGALQVPVKTWPLHTYQGVG